MIITDPVLSPYQIHIDNNGNHTVVKATDRLTKKNEPIFDTEAYCSNTASALKKIVRLKLFNKNKNQAIMINDYIAQLKELTELIKPLNK